MFVQKCKSSEKPEMVNLYISSKYTGRTNHDKMFVFIVQQPNKTTQRKRWIYQNNRLFIYLFNGQHSYLPNPLFAYYFSDKKNLWIKEKLYGTENRYKFIY